MSQLHPDEATRLWKLWGTPRYECLDCHDEMTEAEYWRSPNRKCNYCNTEHPMTVQFPELCNGNDAPYADLQDQLEYLQDHLDDS